MKMLKPMFTKYKDRMLNYTLPVRGFIYADVVHRFLKSDSLEIRFHMYDDGTDIWIMKDDFQLINDEWLSYFNDHTASLTEYKILDAFHYHEATDRTHTILDTMDNILTHHPVVAHNPSIAFKVAEIEKLLGEVYQELGQIENEQITE